MQDNCKETITEEKTKEKELLEEYQKIANDINLAKRIWEQTQNYEEATKVYERTKNKYGKEETIRH